MAVGLRARLRDPMGAAPARRIDPSCPACGVDTPEWACFCARCGFQVRGFSATERLRGLRWEYGDLTVPLGFRHVSRDDSRRRVNQLVLGALRQAGAEGWQTDGPTDFESLEAFDRLVTHSRFNVWRWRDELWIDAVTFRLKRLVET